MFHSQKGMRPRWAGLAPLFPLPGEAREGAVLLPATQDGVAQYCHQCSVAWCLHTGGSRPLGLKGRDMSPERQTGNGGQHP